MRVLPFIFSHCILPLVLSYQISSFTLPKLLAPKDSRFICSLSFSFIPSRRLLNIWFPILSLFVREITIPIHINYSITLIYFFFVPSCFSFHSLPQLPLVFFIFFLQLPFFSFCCYFVNCLVWLMPTTFNFCMPIQYLISS